MDPKDKIELALRAAQIAKEILSLTDCKSRIVARLVLNSVATMFIELEKKVNELK